MRQIIFVIPFAGGSSYSFRAWNSILEFDFVYIDMPGKGTRAREPQLVTFEEMVFEAYRQIQNYIVENKVEEYMIWGHSIGSYLAFRVVELMDINKLQLPKWLILSGSVAPEVTRFDEIVKKVETEQAFIDYIISFGLVSEKVGKSSFFQKNCLSQIMNDYIALLECKSLNKLPKQQCLIVLNGLEDEFTPEDVEKWFDHCNEKPIVKWFPGNHFFIFEHVEELFEEIKKIVI